MTKKYGELTLPQLWERLERLEAGVARAKELRDEWEQNEIRLRKRQHQGGRSR